MNLDWLTGGTSFSYYATWILYAGLGWILFLKNVDPAMYYPDHITRIGAVFIRLKWAFMFFVTWLFWFVVIVFIVGLFK